MYLACLLACLLSSFFALYFPAMIRADNVFICTYQTRTVSSPSWLSASDLQKWPISWLDRVYSLDQYTDSPRSNLSVTVGFIFYGFAALGIKPPSAKPSHTTGDVFTAILHLVFMCCAIQKTYKTRKTRKHSN